MNVKVKFFKLNKFIGNIVVNRNINNDNIIHL